VFVYCALFFLSNKITTSVLLYITVGPPPPAPSEEAKYSLVSLSGLYKLSNVAHADNTSVTYIVKLHTDETNTTSYFWVVSVNIVYTVNRIDHVKCLCAISSFSITTMQCSTYEMHHCTLTNKPALKVTN